MADQRKRGLPENFSLKTDDMPTVIGDYLDEEDNIRSSVVAAKARETSRMAASGVGERRATVTQGVLGSKAQTPVASESAATAPVNVATNSAPGPLTLLTPGTSQIGSASVTAPPSVTARPSLHPAWKRPRRKQLNLSAEAERKLEELVEYFRSYGPQDDIKMSEIFEALVIMAHQSRERLNLSALPRRGAWGSTTEKNFPVLIAETISHAIAGEPVSWPKVENG